MKTSCPHCKQDISATTGIPEILAKPRAGDFTICAYCIELLRFNEDLSVREVPSEEFNLLCAADPDFKISITFAREMARRVLINKQVKQN